MNVQRAFFGILGISLCLLAQTAPANGETFLVANTNTYWQSMTSTGKTITRSNLGKVTICWTNSFDLPRGQRQGGYSFIEEGVDRVENQLAANRNMLPPAVVHYMTLALWDQNQQELPSFSYNDGCGHATSPSGFWIPGFGTLIDFMDLYRDPYYFFRSAIIPSLSMYGTGLSVISSQPIEIYQLRTWMAETNNDGQTYTVNDFQVLDTTLFPSTILVSSSTEDRAALIWHHNLKGFPPPEPVNVRDSLCYKTYRINNDLNVMETSGGADFDPHNIRNITRTFQPALDDNFSPVANDTLRPFPDCDAIYVGDVLHVVFTTVGFRQPIDDWEGYPIITSRESLIWHWNSASDTLTLVANGWFTYDGGPGYWSRNVTSPSIGVGADGTLYCIFRRVNGQDVTEGGYCLGDIWLAISGDNGGTWSEPTPLVETGGVNECFPSLATNVGDNLHIQYLAVPPTNQSPAQEEFEGEVLSVMYLQIAVSDLPDLEPLPMPHEDFQYHVRPPVNFVGREAVPGQFALLGAYPNPFNSKTRISFNLDREQSVRLEARDLQGRTVAILFAGKGSSGENRVVWDATDVPSGVYLISLEGETHAAGMKIALVR